MYNDYKNFICHPRNVSEALFVKKVYEIENS